MWGWGAAGWWWQTERAAAAASRVAAPSLVFFLRGVRLFFSMYFLHKLLLCKRRRVGKIHVGATSFPQLPDEIWGAILKIKYDNHVNKVILETPYRLRKMRKKAEERKERVFMYKFFLLLFAFFASILTLFLFVGGVFGYG